MKRTALRRRTPLRVVRDRPEPGEHRPLLPPRPPTGAEAVASTLLAPELRAIAKPRGRAFSREYLDFAASWSCVSCGAHRGERRIDPDHVGEHPVGRKADDWRAVAACRACHRFRTDHGWFPLDGPRTPTAARATAYEAHELRRRTLAAVRDRQVVTLIAWIRGIDA